jgi:putative ATPase
MKQHGIGVGYKFPHDYEDADVDQQYLPDELAERRYYLPTDQGYEGTIANRMDARAQNRAAGKPRRDPHPKPTMSGSGDVMRTREANRKKLAETQKGDAGD